MEYMLINLLNGLSYGLLLFMLSAGLTLVFSMMGVLNFAHASFYMIGAYISYTVGLRTGFWIGLIVAPILLGALGALIERFGLRSVHRYGHVAELLFTFGLAYVILELVQLIWGRGPVEYSIPKEMDRPLFTLFTTTFPMYRAFMMGVALLMLLTIYVAFKRSRIGLVIQAALTHPDSVEALGHNVPRLNMIVFGGGAALAGLAGAIGGNVFVTEPGMADEVGNIIFVVAVVGGLGSLAGALIASLLIGVLQTFAVSIDYSPLTLLAHAGFQVNTDSPAYNVLNLSVAEIAPILPYLFMILILVFRPKGLMGTRET
jgi:branched-chain amino acid transport system permease protein